MIMLLYLYFHTLGECGGMKVDSFTVNIVTLAIPYTASTYITPIWFKRTSHGWYWTPTDPDPSEDAVNWMPVSREQVVGGVWNGQRPAPRNLVILAALAETYV